MSQKEKRERSINFTREEVDILMELVEANKHILENKKSDAATWHQKKECWKAIEISFNATSGSTYRSPKTLRLKYESIKRDTKKMAALLCAETDHTGQGPSTAEPVSIPSESNLGNMFSVSVDGMECNFDSDSLPNTEGDSQDTAAGSEINTKWSPCKPNSLRSTEKPALSKPKIKRKFEKVAEAKLEVIALQKQILEDEFTNKKRQWAFDEEERQHKREMWALDKKLLLKKLNENGISTL